MSPVMRDFAGTESRDIIFYPDIIPFAQNPSRNFLFFRKSYPDIII